MSFRKAPADDAPIGTEPGSRAPADGSTGAGGAGKRYRHRQQNRRWQILRLTGVGVLGLWFVALAVFSNAIYQRDYLGQDFGTYNQAWSLIGQGHLNPFDTVYGFPFVKADFELILWPLALVHLVLPRPITLLWIQDLAIAGCGLVAYLWVVEYLERRKVAWWPAAGIALVVLLVTIANPGVYLTLIFDFHVEPISTFFILLAGREFWRGRHRRAWIWVGVVLLCGTFAAVMVVGLGVSALLAGRETRRSGLLLVAVGIGWTALVSLLHANQGSGIASYAYLAGRTTLSSSAGVAIIATGIATHPWRVVDQLYQRLSYAWALIKPVGIVGLASAWGFGVPVVVMVTDGLNSRPDFIYQSFQNFAVFPFVLLGTVMVLVWVAQRFRLGWIPALAVALVVTAQALSYGVHRSPSVIRWTLSQVQPGPAAQLRSALAKTPPGAEVIATERFMGRFCARKYCYFSYPGFPREVHGRDVVFVLVTGNESPTTQSDSLAAVTYVRDRLHARVLVDADGVAAFDWAPPPGVNQVTVPAGHRSG